MTSSTFRVIVARENLTVLKEFLFPDKSLALDWAYVLKTFSYEFPQQRPRSLLKHIVD
jgi:hypothetical protein